MKQSDVVSGDGRAPVWAGAHVPKGLRPGRRVPDQAPLSCLHAHIWSQTVPAAPLTPPPWQEGMRIHNCACNDLWGAPGNGDKWVPGLEGIHMGTRPRT